MEHCISEITVGFKPNKMKTSMKINCSDAASTFIRSLWNQDTIEFQEEFKVLLLNNSTEPLGVYTLSRGGITFAGVDLRILFGVILKSGATSFITSHNHPSGKLTPSNADNDLHKKIVIISDLIGIKFLDNLILTKDSYYSFMEV